MSTQRSLKCHFCFKMREKFKGDLDLLKSGAADKVATFKRCLDRYMNWQGRYRYRPYIDIKDIDYMQVDMQFKLMSCSAQTLWAHKV